MSGAGGVAASSTASTGAIVGGVVGGVAVIIIAIALLIWLRRRARQRETALIADRKVALADIVPGVAPDPDYFAFDFEVSFPEVRERKLVPCDGGSSRLLKRQPLDH